MGTQIIFGPESPARLPPSESRLIVASNSFLEGPNELLISHLADGVPRFQVVKKPPGEPSIASVNQVLKEMQFEPSEIVAVGGGSTIDLGKAVSLAVSSGVSPGHFESISVDDFSVIPVVAIPTTPGSGSEVTKYCVLTNEVSQSKFTLASDSLAPGLALINPLFLENLPIGPMFDSAFDSLSHCLEAGLKPNRRSAVERLVSEACGLAVDVFESLKSRHMDYMSLARLSWLGILGGLSINKERTGLIHTISVALAPHTALPHGRLNRLITPYVLRFNLREYGGDLARLVSFFGNVETAKDAEAAQFLIAWLDAVFPVNYRAFEHFSIPTDRVVARVQKDYGLPDQNHRVLDGPLLETLVAQIVEGDLAPPRS